MDATKYMKGIQHIGIPTNDLEKTIAFYQRLGFIIAHQTINEKANIKQQIIEIKIPPKKPSQVFFGEILSLIRCFPNKTPTKYAPMSFNIDPIKTNINKNDE